MHEQYAPRGYMVGICYTWYCNKCGAELGEVVEGMAELKGRRGLVPLWKCDSTWIKCEKCGGHNVWMRDFWESLDDTSAGLMAAE